MLVRASADAEARAQLIHAARVLAAVDHPGLETLIALDDDGTRTRLVTAFAGARTLADTPPRRPEEFQRVAGAVLATLAALHREGIVHGRITPDRVLLGPGGRPVVCDLLAAERPPAEALDLACRRELACFGRLLEDLLVGIRVRPLRHPRRWLLLRRCRGSARRLAECDGSGPTRIRPSPEPPPAHRALAAGRRRARALADRTRPGRTAPDRRVLRFVLAGLLAAAGLGCILSGLRTSSGAEPGPARAVPETTVHGNRVHTAGLTYRIGRTGDRVVVGDWDGDGVRTPALLRPSSGMVHRYRAWPAPGTPLDAPPVTRVPGATDLRVVADPGGPDVLSVIRGPGEPEVRVASEPYP